MAAVEVRICARGALSELDRRELPGFEESGDGSLVVLRGVVVDQPALLGVLERLRRAGLHIRDVERVSPEGPTEAGGPAVAVARFEFTGMVADLLRITLAEAQLVEDSATTTMEVALGDDDDALFGLLARIEQLALDIREVHVRPGVTPGAGVE